MCGETHVPGYLKELEALSKQGVDQIICVSVGDEDTVSAWGKKVVPSGGIKFAADRNGGLTRIFGMNLPAATQDDPASLRYSMALEDGIILKVVRAHGCVPSFLCFTEGKSCIDGFARSNLRFLLEYVLLLLLLQKVEDSPADVKQSSAKEMVAFLKSRPQAKAAAA